MFRHDQPESNRSSQWAIGGLTLLSVVALIVTVWILSDFSRELEILRQLTKHLPESDMEDANELAGELRLQWQLSVLLILNIFASGVALTLLIRAYLSSERSLREVSVLATDILASIDQGIITTDRDASILRINPRGRELLDQSVNEAGAALSDLPPEHATLNEICNQVLKARQPVREHDYTVNRNGNVRHLRAGCSLLQDHRRRHLGTVIHLRDVTEKTLMEQQLRRMERFMGLGSLAAGLQHEIKNPLSALSLHVQLLSETLHEEMTNPDIQESLDVLKDETRRITGVLEGFRDFASVEALNRNDVELPVLIEKLVRLIEPQAKQANIRIDVELPEGPSAYAWIDAARIEQVLLNLVVNAITAMSNGGVLSIRLKESADPLEVEVVDTGGGIPSELQGKVFDPYFTTRSTGTGMGLALSEKIVRQHNGTIDFRTSSIGTIFTISLPQDKRHED